MKKSFIPHLTNAFSILSLSICLLSTSPVVASNNKIPLKCKPTLYIISAPSGTGKTTVMNMMMDKYPSIIKLVSVTTRAPRKNEKSGVDYRFIKLSDYKKNLKDNQFIEAFESYGNHYGILRSNFENLLNSGHDMIVDLNYNGMKQLIENIKGEVNIVTFFIMPPSISELEKRLSNRGTDSKEIISNRMAQVMTQLEDYKEYDYILTAPDKNEIVQEIETVYKARNIAKNSCKKGDERMLSIEREYNNMKK